MSAPPSESPSLPLLSLVSLIWGSTNLLLKRRSKPSLLRSLLDPLFVVGLVLNLCGSGLFYVALGSGSVVVVPLLVNAGTMVVTAVGGRLLLGEEIGSIPGVLLVCTGIAICSFSAIEHEEHFYEPA